jgi:hypothetical protein
MPVDGQRSAAVGAGADGVDPSRFIVHLPWRTPATSERKVEELVRVDERLPPTGADVLDHTRNSSPLASVA